MVVVACACGASLAGPFYVGGSYGDASIEIDTSGFEFDDSDSGWKLYAGYRFLKFFGVEGSYVDLGAPSEGSVEVETTGWDAFGVGVLPLGPIELFAKAGAVSWETDVSGAGSDDGTDAAYGIGVGFSLKKIAFRLELEQFDVEDTDTVQMASVGVEWRF
jgi:OOP family OmpA-OmpF porin